MELNEDRYEHIDMIIKTPAPDGESWFDKLFDLITSYCNAEEDDVCTCGLESMGGGGGTLEQCWDHARITEKWAIDVQADDLKWALTKIDYLNLSDEDTKKLNRLHDAAYWHDDFNERYSNLEDDEMPTHLEHFQQCNCLSDSAECCREGCWCKDEV